MINNILSNDRTKSTSRTDQSYSDHFESDYSDDENSVENRSNMGGNKRIFEDNKFDCTVIASGTLRHINCTYDILIVLTTY